MKKRKGMLELITANGAGESVQAGLDESRKIVERVVSGKRNTIVSPKDHHNTDTRAVREQYKTDIVSPSDQDHIRITKGSPSEQKISLPKQQTIVYDWFLRHGFKGSFNKGFIVRETGVPYITVRKAIKRLVETNILRLSYDKTLKQFDYEINTEIKVKRSNIISGSYQDQNNIRAPHYIEEEERTLLLEKINIIYPNLHGIGFEQSQLQDVIQSWKTNKLDLDQLPESLQRADFAVENKSFKMDNPLDYVYKSLMRGVFRKPPGFKSMAEIQAEEMLAEQRHIADMREDAFQLWCDNLPLDKRAEYCNGVPRLKHRARLQEVFDKNHG